MSLSATCESVSQKRTVSSLLAGRVLKRPKQEDALKLQEATMQLLEQQQNLSSLLREAGDPDVCSMFLSPSGEQDAAGSLLVCELRRQASRLGVPVTVLSVKTMMDRLMEITRTEDTDRGLLTSCQRVQVRVLLESTKQLLSQGVFCPKLLWQEFRRDQKLPLLEVVHHLHNYNILPLKCIIDSDEGSRSWLVVQLETLCSWTPPEGDQEAKQVQQEVLSTVVGVLVGRGFDLNQDQAAADRRTSLLCCSVLDHMLSWLLDAAETTETPQEAGAAAQRWLQVFDASLCGASVSGETLQRFFTHSLTHTLTYKPRLTVSDAVTLQNQWTFAKSSRLLTSLFCKLSVVFSVERLLSHLQQVLETHEVNWNHVLCFLSTLLVYNPRAQSSLTELLSRLLSSAFEGYDLENVITAFLLARQAALEGAAIFPSYSSWFKLTFGGVSSPHAASKKSLVFLLKFLSDLVPFEPSQYLKVHVLQPPYVPAKHRGLLMEYVSLAKTRLADLKESVEDMGLYEDVSAAGGSSVQCQAVQDVDRAVSLFQSTGRISAAVMEASIFRRPYFLTRFLPALLRPRMLPVKADALMSFIETLRKADKIPAAQYSSYVESCSRQRQQQDADSVRVDDGDDEPLDVLKLQLHDFTQLVVQQETDGETSALLSRISHTLTVLFPGRPEEPNVQTVIELHTNTPQCSGLHGSVVNMILRCFCQCLLDASRYKPPNKQSQWASMFVRVLLGNHQVFSNVLHRLWDLLHNQASSLSPAHVLGLAAFLVHIQTSVTQNPLVQLVPPGLPGPVPPGPVPVVQALSSALECRTKTDMLLCVRLCTAAVCYGVCRGDSQPDFILSCFYKKLLFLVPRLLPETRRHRLWSTGPGREDQDQDQDQDRDQDQDLDQDLDLWSRAMDSSSTWRKTAVLLWRHPVFCRLENTPQYQLSFSEWLKNELRVQRSEDALTDPERLDYQQWVCSEVYLPRPEEHGGCGGDLRNLCSQLIHAVMEEPLRRETCTRDQDLESPDHRGTCLPDLLSRLQECVYDMAVSDLSSRRGGGANVCDFLFEFVSQRVCSASGSELSVQHTLHSWNRVLLALPAELLVRVNDEGGRKTLDCRTLIQHVNQHQRRTGSPASLMSCRLTLHLLRGVLSASTRCDRPEDEVNKTWSQISLRCPLLLVSTAHWWNRLSPVMMSLWRRLSDGERLPEQLQLLTDCHTWACRLVQGPSESPVPAAAALLLAASLHRAWQDHQDHQDRQDQQDHQDHRDDGQNFIAALKTLRPESHHRQVLVFLLFLSVKDRLTSLLDPQERIRGRSSDLSRDLLLLLADSADWLLIFTPQEPGPYQSVSMVTSDQLNRLMPWAFYSLLQQQSTELLHRAVCSPGFLHTAVHCYARLLQLHLEGTPPAAAPTESSDSQVDPFLTLNQAKQLLLAVISQSPPSCLSSSQRRQLESQCADLDPEVSAALSVHLDPHSLSPEMDFL